MKIRIQNRIMTGIMGVSALILASQSPALAQSPYGQTNHLHPQMPVYFGAPSQMGPVRQAPPPVFYAPPSTGRHSHMNQARPRFAFPSGPRHPYQAQPRKKYDGLMARLKGQKTLASQVPAPPPPPSAVFQQWQNYEPQYTFYPGDQLDIVVTSAPELSRTLTIAPDGRISMPMVKPIMAAGHTLEYVQRAIEVQLATQLRNPSIAVTPRAFAPAQVYVGGAVGAPGTYTLPGPVGVLETVIMAGGMRPTAKTSQVAVLRRAPNGGMMMRPVNIRNGLNNIREYDDNMQLKRGDIVFVPQTTLAEVGNFMQSLRNAIPIDFNVSYNIGNNGGGTDPSILNNGTTTTITP